MKKPCHLLTHSCASSNFRCHKKRAATGDSISRFKVNRPCEETYFKEVARPHSQEAGRLLEKLDLAEKSPGHQTVYRAMKEASAAAFNYDADGGELFSPVNAKFFAMIRRNMNCLLCDKVMSAAYLANFAAGVEERATVTVEGQVIALLMSALKKWPIPRSPEHDSLLGRTRRPQKIFDLLLPVNVCGQFLSSRTSKRRTTRFTYACYP